MIEAVIFDLDGVLADTEAFSGRATEKALGEYGIKLTPKEKKRAFGRTDLDIAAHAIKLRNLDLKPEVLVRKKDRIYWLEWDFTYIITSKII